MKRIAWGITGSGDLIKETFEIMVDIKKRTDIEIMVFLSKEGETVMKWYRMWDELKKNFKNIKTESGPNSPFIAGPLQVGYYDLLLVAPLTANSTAKIAYGIADTLVTNAVAQTAKGTTPIYLLPVDQVKGTIKTYAPNGKEFELKMRDIDINNSETLSKMENINIIGKPEDIYDLFDL
ncbi:archaeoflavoprotein AfpA [Methanosalsum natronophilum]|uniref:Archaeoflavoprotein AfpA n=1 Tax=Methanosalsum natronophilum TaxID=768733 RepID=A0A3R7VX06_9EURY|nr:archaeoflavoprotein AfpA [Methanosalsum natronophilum]MCS3923464.1 archaeoflavoprotein AfpA [Methanosalsum natronophilum]RQD82710.1 MAG: archaeoflavoprotein AfpA [Methanosalsum natronophilum]